MKGLEQTLVTMTPLYEGSWSGAGNHDSVVWRIYSEQFIHHEEVKVIKQHFRSAPPSVIMSFNLYKCLTECLHQFCHFKVSIIFILLYEFLLPSSKLIIANYTGSSHMLISSLPSSSSVDMWALPIVPSWFHNSHSMLNLNLAGIFANFKTTYSDVLIRQTSRPYWIGQWLNRTVIEYTSDWKYQWLNTLVTEQTIIILLYTKWNSHGVSTNDHDTSLLSVILKKNCLYYYFWL